MTFLNQSSEGRKLGQFLQTEGAGREFIEISNLEKPFFQISDKFLAIHRDKIRNIGEDGALFKEGTRDRHSVIQLADPKILAEKVDIVKLHGLLSAY